DEIWEQKAKRTAFDGDVLLSPISADETPLVVGISRFVVLPSQREARKIQNHITDLQIGSTRKSTWAFALQPNFYQGMDLEELTEHLSRVETTFRDEDLYEKFEKLGSKVNLLLTNTGAMYLEDVIVVITVPATPGLEIAPKQYYQGGALAAAAVHIASAGRNELKYPEVKLKGGMYEILQSLGTLRHGVPKKLFMTDLRIFAARELSSQKLQGKVMIFAKNLREPLEREIQIPFGE